MSRAGKTKSRMLKVLASRRKAVAELSRELGLAPSTVSEHMKELLMLGLVRPIDNPYYKRAKYYSIAQVPASSEPPNEAVAPEIVATV